MKVKVKILDEAARLPFKTHANDFCYDVVATSEKRLCWGVWKYGIGLSFQMERNDETLSHGNVLRDKNGLFYGRTPDWKIELHKSPMKLSIDLRPRSSVWKTGMVLSNGEGTIDEDYRGEVSAVFYHVLPWKKRYHVGDRIGQIKLGMSFPIDFVEVEALSDTERGAGGYGSTGK